MLMSRYAFKSTTHKFATNNAIMCVRSFSLRLPLSNNATIELVDEIKLGDTLLFLPIEKSIFQKKPIWTTAKTNQVSMYLCQQ